MEDLKWEQYDLDVLVKENNKPTEVMIKTDSISNKWINIELRNELGEFCGRFELNFGVKIEQLEKAIYSINSHCEMLKQEKIDGYVPKCRIAKYDEETGTYKISEVDK